jgi:hypothetical protein
MRDVLNPPPAKDALAQGKPAHIPRALPASVPEPSSGEYGKYAPQMEQMRKDRTAVFQVVEKLPEADRDMLPDVLQTVDQLMERASDLARTLNHMEGDVDSSALQDLGNRIESLKRESEGAENDRRIGLLERQRDSLAELVKRSEAIESQFESCVLAIQNMRFDLLRLRSAGVSAVINDLTSATQQAQALRIDVEAAIGAAGEIREALGQDRH